MQQINIAMPGPLVNPPPEGTQKIELPTQHVTGEEATSSHPALEEATFRVIEVTDSEEDFEVLDQLPPAKSPHTSFSHLTPAQVSSNQEPSDVPKAMVLQRKKSTSLPELLESHAGWSAPKVAIQTHPPTPLPTHASPSQLADKKRNRVKQGKDVSEEGEVAPSKDLY